MGLNVTVNGRPVRSPVVRVLAALIMLLLLIVAVLVGAAILIPLVGAAVVIGVVGTGAFLLSPSLRRRFLNRRPTATAPRPTVLEEEDRVARAKPVERL